MHFRFHLGVASGGFAALAIINALALAALLGHLAVTHRLSDALDLVTVLNSTPTYRAIGQFCVGLACVGGGFVAARIARQSPITVGALSAWLCCGLALYAFIAGRSRESLALVGVYVASFIALGALGGRLGSGGARLNARSGEL